MRDQPKHPAPPGKHASAGTLLFRVALFFAASVSPGGALHGAEIAASNIPGLSELAAGPGADLAGEAVTGGSFILGALAVGPRCSNCQGFAGPGAGCKKATELADASRFPSPDLPPFPAADLIIAPVELPTDKIALDLAPDQSSLRRLRMLADATTPRPDKPAAKPEKTDAAGPFWSAKGDIVVRDMVPVLAALALFVAGLLLREAVRRRRRTVLARRIKRSFDRSARRRPSPKSASNGGE